MPKLTFHCIPQGWGADHWLKAKESADVLSYTSMIEEKLLPASVSITCYQFQINVFHFGSAAFMVG
jgi:hypothetical protein